MVPTRTAKSCGSDAPIVGVKSARRRAGDGVKKRGHRGEREVSRKTIARGMPGRSGVTVVTNSYAFLFCMRGRGCIARPAFPAPSIFQGERFLQNLGRLAPRECGDISEIGTTSLRGAKRRSNPLLLSGNMDCFACARNDGLNTRHTFNRHRPRKRAIQYSRDVSDRTERPRRTGYPAGACHRARRRRDPVAGYDERLWQRIEFFQRPRAIRRCSPA